MWPENSVTVKLCGASFSAEPRLNPRQLKLSPGGFFARLLEEKGAEDRVMKTMVKLLVALGFAAALSGCVVAPGPYYHHRHAYVVAPAPVVVVRPCCARW